MPSRSASSSAQPAWVTPRTSASQWTNLQHKAPKTQVQTCLNQTSAPSKIKNNHTKEMMKLEEGQTKTNFLCTVGVFPCSNVSVACLSWRWNSVFLGANTFSAEGKDGSPMGVVRRGGVHVTCSVKCNRSKSHIISLHRPTSLYP